MASRLPQKDIEDLEPEELTSKLSISSGDIDSVAKAVAKEGKKEEEEFEKEEKDPYRSYLTGPGEQNTHWRHGAPPKYHLVNHLFNTTRTQEWGKGSLEEVVQNLVKSWEMELSHKTRVEDFKTIHPAKFRFFVNGRRGLTAEETLAMGSYNALLMVGEGDGRSSTSKELNDYYRAEEETFESSHDVFRAAFPKGFAWEVLEVYSGPPTVAFKYRHWGFLDGPYKGHLATGRLVQSFGTCVAKVDDQLRIMDLEVYYDPIEFLSQLTEGPKSPDYGTDYKKGTIGCPFMTTTKEFEA